VNSVHVDRLGDMWVGTQDGLDKFDPQTGTFKTYYQQDGLAGDVVGCILEDKRGLLWMSTNNGLSNFDPQSQRFRNFSAADGLPGPDLTGWGACYESPSGEMFFGGFAGATAFYPSRLVNSPFVPRTVLTEFSIGGIPVPVGRNSPLKRSITFSDSITLSHLQNMFSIEFSALSYFNPETNRYRLKLEGLDDRWHEVGSSQRTVSYTTLPAATYFLDIQGATSRGNWDEPGVRLRIEVMPAWYQTFWFRATVVGMCAVAILIIYRMRLRGVMERLDLRFEERLAERTRIARDLHDTLLQSFQGSMFRMQAARNLLELRPQEAVEELDGAIGRAEQAIVEGRNAIQDLRADSTNRSDLADLLKMIGQELAGSQQSEHGSPIFRVTVEGNRRELFSILQDEIYRIAHEVLRNAFQHAAAQRIEAEIRYDDQLFRMRIRDDGRGIDAAVLKEGRRAGHWGLPGIRERARQIGARLEFWSDSGVGTEVELTVPSSIAYAKSNANRRFKLFRKKVGSHGP
jgi:signal transduction histidine kinase